MKAKRGYSKAFTPNKATEKRYLLDNIPEVLWLRVAAKCQRVGISRRAIILQLLEEWSLRS